MTTLTPEQVELYLDDLNDLSSERLAYGFRMAKRHWKPEYGRTFPSIAEIREFAMQYQPPEKNPLLERGDKPPSWEPLTKEESAEFLKKLQAMRKEKDR